MVPPLTAQAVAELVGGRLIGPGDAVVESAAPLERAGPRALSLLTSRRYADHFRATRAAVVLMPPDLADLSGPAAARVLVGDAHAALAAVLALLHPAPAPASFIHPSATLGTGVRLGQAVCIEAGAVLGRGVQLGDRTRIGAGAVLEAGVTVGADSVLGPRVVCYEGTLLGARVVAKAGAVLGGPGFGYASSPEGHRRMPHVGRCVIEDDVEIGSNSCVDRGSIDDTVIGQGTKLDNLVQVGHNVRIGRRCLLMAAVGIAGSARIGDDVILAGQSGVGGHVSVGAGVRAAAQSGLVRDVAAGMEVSGFPARPHREVLRSQAVLYRLAPLARTLEAMARERAPDA